MAAEQRIIDVIPYTEGMLINIAKAKKKYFGNPVMREVINLLEIIRNELLELPTVDAVEVVRCRDCKHWDKDFGWCDKKRIHMVSGDFCSYGERRTNETDKR